MKQIYCLLKLTSDADWLVNNRTVEISLVRDKNQSQGSWQVIRNARDTRMAITPESGIWAYNKYANGNWTVDLLDAELGFVVILNGAGGNPFDVVNCSKTVEGKASRVIIPQADLDYRLFFNCV